jgi:hypothetical protein
MLRTDRARTRSTTVKADSALALRRAAFQTARIAAGARLIR